MKQWYRSLAMKLVCFLLCVPLSAAAVLSVMGIGYMLEEDYYVRSPQEKRTEMYVSAFRMDMVTVLEHILNGESIPTNMSINHPKKTNLRYRICDYQGNTVYQNMADAYQAGSYQLKLVFRAEKAYYKNVYVISYDDEAALTEDCYTAYGYVDPQLPVQDSYRQARDMTDLAYRLRDPLVYIAPVLVLLAVACFLNLTFSAGRRPGTQTLHAGRLDSMPTDVLLAVVGIPYYVAFYAMGEAICEADRYGLTIFSQVLAGILLLGMLYGLLGLWMCLASRVKRKQLLQNTLVWKVLTLLWRGCRAALRGLRTLVRAIPLVWRTALAALGLVVWNFIMLGLLNLHHFLTILMFLAESAVVTAFLLWTALCLRRLQRAGQALAAGDLTYQLDTTGMYGDLKAHGADLNSIAQGMNRAVADQMKSQHMKTELIANVSHDIKNPLTSIINYAGLIAQEPCENENHRQYAQVLSRKSLHLKRLLEDLVELSRATTGNMELELSPCQADVLLEQLTGEYQDRCRQAGLTLVVRQPESPVRILADSRRIWRVFDNLLNNACKYALEGTRVYLNLARQGDQAVFALSNISREPLELSPEELLERFVRGDSARTTEGSGLGLSIAQSLTSLQGGRMQLDIDGDLFKVTLFFPLAEA